MKDKFNSVKLKEILEKEKCMEYLHNPLIIIQNEMLQVTPCCKIFGDKLKEIARIELKRMLCEDIENTINRIFHYPHF